MFVNASEIVLPAKKNGYAILGACPQNADEIGWCIEEANAKNSPIILCKNLSVAKKGQARASLKEFADAARFFSSQYPKVPVALCLDHGYAIETCMEAIQNDFTLIMMDRSMMTLEDNINALKTFVPIAHSLNVSVEGALGGTEWRDPTPEEVLDHMTKPIEFKKLVTETDVDSVCVFVGGSHGDHKTGAEVIHYDLINELRDSSDAWLVMHGCSHMGDEKLAKGAKNGLSKLNVSGDLSSGAVRGVAELLESGKNVNATTLSIALRRGHMKRVGEFMDFLGSTNRIGENR